MMTLLTFAFVMIVTAILFGGWLIACVIQFVWRLLTGPGRQQAMSQAGRACANPGCRTGNPTHARFCRRCGTNLSQQATGSLNSKGNRNGGFVARYNPMDGRGRQSATFGIRSKESSSA